nr:hypothetical protein [Tanacetum cinerariifolium]
DNENATNLSKVPPTPQASYTLSTIKLPILKKGEYDIWAMKIEHYLGHKDYPIWEAIQKGNGPVHVSIDTHGQIRVLPPKTTKEILARERKKISLIMKTKPRVDNLSFDDLYNNLRVFESDVKGYTASSSSTQNVAFVSSDSTNSTNEVSTAYSVSTSFGHNLQKEGSSSYTDELIYSFFSNQSSGPQLDHEDLEQVDEFDLEEMDLKWQVAMISTRLKKFYKKTGRKLHFDAKEQVSFNKTKVECFNCHNTWHFARECKSKGNQESRKRDAGNTGHKAIDNGRRPVKHDEHKAMVTIDGEGSNTEVTSCSKVCEESYAKLKKLYDEQREKLGVASIEIQAYALALKKMSAKDKSGLEYGTQIHEGVLSYENKLLESMFDSRSSDVEDSHVNDSFAKVKEMHAVPPLMTGNYMPPKFDFGIDESKFTYGPKQSKNSESDAKTSDLASCKSNSSVETLESVPKPVKSNPKLLVNLKLVEQEIPSYAFINTVKHVKSPRQTVKDYHTCSQNPKVHKRDWTGLMSKRLGFGYGYTKKACFVCGSFSHLIRDCDFHEKRMAKQVELNKSKNKVTCQRHDRPVFLVNAARQNFSSQATLTKTVRKVNAARQNFSSQAASTSTVRKVNTARQIINDIRLRDNLFKSHSPIRRPFNRTTAPKANFANHKVNTAGDKRVSATGGNRETAIKASAGCNWRSKRHYWNKVSKYNSGSKSRKYDSPHQTLKRKGIVDSGCSRHMTGNKSYLAEYQDLLGPYSTDL